MEDFQVEIPEIEVPEVEFCDVETEMDYELEMEDENVVDIEDGESETERQSRPKAQNPNRQIQQNRQKHQSPRKVQVKVNDYLRCSVMTATLCNCLFLGTAALMCSLKVRTMQQLITHCKQLLFYLAPHKVKHYHVKLKCMYFPLRKPYNCLHHDVLSGLACNCLML